VFDGAVMWRVRCRHSSCRTSAQLTACHHCTPGPAAGRAAPGQQAPALCHHHDHPSPPPATSPLQVLTSDELTGSLRQLAPCFTVAKDRFKALQKRGLVEVRAPRSGKKGRRVAYEGGARQEKALEGQAEVEAMTRKRVAAERALRGKQQLG
jgi:hypothetical protein